MSLIAIKSNISSRAHIFHPRILFPYAITTNQSSPLICLSSCSGSSPSRTSARTELGCAGNPVFGERLSRLLTSSDQLLHWLLPGGDERSATSSSSRWTFLGLLGCAGNQVFGSVFRDCSLPRISYFTGFFLEVTRDRLHRLLPGGRSWDCTANIFLHRLWSTSSSNALYQLVRMEPPVPSALVPHLRIILNDYILFLICLQYFAMFISNLSSDKIAHVHIYATTLLCVIF